MNDYENEMEFDDRILETAYTAEDAETEFSLRPRTLDEYIGQEKVKEVLKIYIDAVKLRGDTLDHCCMARRGCAKRPFPVSLRRSWA